VGLEGREWVGDGDEQPGRNRLRLDLLGAVRAGDERVADGKCGRELDLRRLGRSLLGDGGLQRGHGWRQVGGWELLLPARPSPPSFTTRRCRDLSVSKAGSGSGTVTSSPGGIDCGSTCSAQFAQGTSVSLTAAAGANSTFAGWSGACSGTGACSVVMDSDKSVTATFSPAQTPQRRLSVTKVCTGSGTVT